MAELIKSKRKEDTEGSTKAKASYSITRDDDGDVEVRVDFSVKKTGVTGTGKGVVAFALLDDAGESLFKIEKGFTVGADALDGVAKKEHSEFITLFGSRFDKVAGVAFFVGATNDTIGLPTSPGEWTELLGEAVPAILGGLSAGGTTTVVGWVIDRLK